MTILQSLFMRTQKILEEGKPSLKRGSNTNNTVSIRQFKEDNVQSEVARTKENIELQYAAARFALCGSSQGTAQHKIITTKMERLYDDLIKEIGERRATEFLVKTMDMC